MYFFAAKGMRTVQDGRVEITAGGLFTGNQKGSTPDKYYLLTQHAATSGKSIAEQ